MDAARGQSCSFVNQTKLLSDTALFQVSTVRVRAANTVQTRPLASSVSALPVR